MSNSRTIEDRSLHAGTHTAVGTGSVSSKLDIVINEHEFGETAQVHSVLLTAPQPESKGARLQLCSEMHELVDASHGPQFKHSCGSRSGRTETKLPSASFRICHCCETTAGSPAIFLQADHSEPLSANECAAIDYRCGLSAFLSVCRREPNTSAAAVR